MRLALQISEQLEPLKKMSVAKRHVRQLGGAPKTVFFVQQGATDNAGDIFQEAPNKSAYRVSARAKSSWRFPRSI